MLGIAITFLTTGSLNFNEIAHFTVFYDDSISASVLGFLLLLSAFLFKLGVFPFHMWLVDVYDGVLILLTAFFSIVPKIILVGLVVRLLLVTFGDFFDSFSELISVLAFFSIALASVCAFFQKRIKRLLAYSAISHVGFMLIALVCQSLEAFKSIISYASIYTFTSAAAFALILNSTTNGSALRFIVN